jgi:hypothetical protein
MELAQDRVPVLVVLKLWVLLVESQFCVLQFYVSFRWTKCDATSYESHNKIPSQYRTQFFPCARKPEVGGST